MSEAFLKPSLPPCRGWQVKKELLHAKHEAAGWDADLAREANQMKAELSNQRHCLVNVTTLVRAERRRGGSWRYPTLLSAL